MLDRNILGIALNSMVMRRWKQLRFKVRERDLGEFFYPKYLMNCPLQNISVWFQGSKAKNFHSLQVLTRLPLNVAASEYGLTLSLNQWKAQKMVISERTNLICLMVLHRCLIYFLNRTRNSFLEFFISL